MVYFDSPFRQEGGMQVDGAEEEVPGELENICSDDGELFKHLNRLSDSLAISLSDSLIL